MRRHICEMLELSESTAAEAAAAARCFGEKYEVIFDPAFGASFAGTDESYQFKRGLIKK